MSSKRGTRSGRKKEVTETPAEKAAREHLERVAELKKIAEAKQKERTKAKHAKRVARREAANEKRNLIRQEVSRDRLVLPADPNLIVKGPTGTSWRRVSVADAFDFDKAHKYMRKGVLRKEQE